MEQDISDPALQSEAAVRSQNLPRKDSGAYNPGLSKTADRQEAAAVLSYLSDRPDYAEAEAKEHPHLLTGSSSDRF